MPELNLKRIEQYIRNATVKLFVDDSFRGTGFFIARAGYVLTAYHCVGPDPGTIQLETPFDGVVAARLDPDKSLPAYDLAMLKTEHQPSHCLPLGTLTDQQISDPVVTIGYPASHLTPNQAVGTYKGYLSRWRQDDVVELSDAIKGKGHSGSSVYHYDSGRVVGVVTDRYKGEVMADAGLAARVDRLFAKWPELAGLNQATAEQWDRRLQSWHRDRCQHPIAFAMLPDDGSADSLLAALRTVFEDRWGCQVLTLQDRHYRDSTLDSLRIHLEQAAIFVAEVSAADPQVMFMLGAAQFALSQVPTVLLAQGTVPLPPLLQGRGIVHYNGAAPDLTALLEDSLSKLAPLQHVLADPDREHFLAARRLQAMGRLPLSEKIWQRLQARYPTQEDWHAASQTVLARLLGAEADLAGVLLQRIQEELA